MDTIKKTAADEALDTAEDREAEKLKAAIEAKDFHLVDIALNRIERIRRVKGLKRL